MDAARTRHELDIDGTRIIAEKVPVGTLERGDRDAWKISAHGEWQATLPYSVYASTAMLEEAMRTVVRMRPFTAEPPARH